MAKYNSKKININGIKFDSQAESDYYLLLKRWEKAGKIRDLTLQPVFKLQDKYRLNGKAVKEITYKADFMYYDIKNNKTVVVDVKGMATEVANIKRKIFNFLYGSEMELIWVVKNKKYGDSNGWCEYDLLKKLRAKAKKDK